MASCETERGRRKTRKIERDIGEGWGGMGGRYLVIIIDGMNERTKRYGLQKDNKNLWYCYRVRVLIISDNTWKASFIDFIKDCRIKWSFPSVSTLSTWGLNTCVIDT